MIHFLRLILPSLYFALPMYAANMAPVIFKRLPLFAWPVDFGLMRGGKPVLGPNKTWRGFVFGVLVAIGVVWLQVHGAIRYPGLRAFGVIDYVAVKPALLGVLLGFGSILGDAVKSFFKRRIGIRPGGPWMPFDQIDFVLGGLLLSCFYVFPGLISACIILLFTPFLHLGVNMLAYKLGIKSVPW